MADDILIRGLTAEDAWDCALGVLEDVAKELHGGDARQWALRDLAEIEQRRRVAFLQRAVARKR